MSKLAKRVILIILLLFIISLLVVITVYFYEALPNQKHDQEENILEDIKTARALEEMAEGADLIVLGTYEGLDSTWNMAGKEESNLYLAGKLFTFHVDEILKGSLPNDEIMINHIYSLPFQVEEAFGYEDKEVEAVDPTYISPSFQKRYLAFLKKSEQGDFYMRAQEPFLISVDKHDLVKLESKMLEELNFEQSPTGKTLAEIKNEIKGGK